MIIYLTYNDPPTGVYWGQVTDVVVHMNTLGGPRVRLVALVSVRGFVVTRNDIRKRVPDALVLPMVPGVRNWRSNHRWIRWVCARLKPTGIMARGVFATALALQARDEGSVARVCFDGRGAYAAEWEEYRVVEDEALIAECRPLEADAVLRSDVRVAVSEALVTHWRERYGYDGDEHLVIPCTLGRDVSDPVDPGVAAIRYELGWSEEDTLLVYAGSTVGWQSLGLLDRLLDRLLERDPNTRVLFLSRDRVHAPLLMRRFPGQVAQRWVEHAHVRSALMACDAGILLREDSITNRVASPTKFAEYLSAGLPVIISEHLGDLSSLVEQEDLGWVMHPDGPAPPVRRMGELERQRLVRFAQRYFTKHAYDDAYKKLLDVMNTTA